MKSVINTKVQTDFKIRLLLFAVIMLVSNVSMSYAQNNEPYECPEIPISYINGDNGFIIEGIAEDDEAGFVVSNAGRINDDDIDDFLVSAPLADTAEEDAGVVYVIFGQESEPFDFNFDLSTLDGTNGFMIQGETNEGNLGFSASALADINDDGFDDIVIAEPGNESAYVVFGNVTFSSVLLTSDIAGDNGFRIISSTDTRSFGTVVDTVGDINDDNHPDFIVYSSTDVGGLSGKGNVIFGVSGTFPDVFDTATLNGTNGFVINYDTLTGSSRRDEAAVSRAGDVNRDGIDDVILGFAYGEGVIPDSGIAYVLFGRETTNPFPSEFLLSDLDGNNGFEIVGAEDGDRFGISVSEAGDMNADGVDDMIIGAYYADVETLTRAGKAYVIFGNSTGFGASIDISTLNGSNGFIIEGGESYGYVGFSVSNAGEFNDDDIDDIIIGAYGINSGGAAYILYGKDESWDRVFDTYLIDGINGIEILDNARISRQRFGHDVHLAGDINGDDRQDLIIGAISKTTFSYNLPGSAYVVYGGTLDGSIDSTPPVIANFPDNVILAPDVTLPEYIQPMYEDITDGCQPNNTLIITQDPPRGTRVTNGMIVTIRAEDRAGNSTECQFTVTLQDIEEPECYDIVYPEQLSGANGFTMMGPYVERAGWSTFVSDAGDINNDGLDDVIILVAETLANYDNQYVVDDAPFEAYVVYGSRTPFPSTFDLFFLTPSQGFKIIKESSGGFEFVSADKIGDFNDDGIDDIILNDSYEAFVIYGRDVTSPFPFEFNVESLDGNNGFTVTFDDETNSAGGGNIVRAAGDVNGDENADIILGTYYSSPNGVEHAGNAYVVFGTDSTFPSNFDLDDLNGSNGFKMNGLLFNGRFGQSASGIGDINADGFGDIVVGAPYSEINGVSRTGQAFVVFGPGPGAGSSEIDLTTLDGSNGFVITGINDGRLGAGTAGMFDINGDTYSDFVVTAPEADDGNPGAGVSYVIFGNQPNYPENFDLNSLDGTNGFAIYGESFISQSGASINSAGDFNNDTIDDLILGAQYGSDGNVYVVYGNTSWNAVFDLGQINSSNGVHFLGTNDSARYLGSSVDGIGDFNGDEIDDIFMGRIPDSPFNQVQGKTHIVFGGNTDTVVPTIETCPEDQILAIGADLPDYTTMVDAMDTCDADVEITQSPEAGITFTANISVTITVTDDSGNQAECTFSVSEEGDTIAPEITCPVDQELGCDITTISDYTSLVTATDNSGESPFITQSPAPRSVFIPGMEITMTATDGSGNTIDCTFMINEAADTTTPEITTCVSDQTLAVGADLPDYTAMVDATDTCDADIEITQSPAAGTLFTTNISVTITATDDSGNQAQCTFSVSEEGDTIAPEITCPVDQELGCDVTILPDYTSLVTATDNSGESPLITQSPVPGSAFTSGMEITMTATDDSGNTIDCTFMINEAADTTAPEITTCVSDQTLALGTTLPDYTAMVDATDTCDADIEITQSPAAGTPFTTNISVTITAIDDSGNQTQCTFSVSEEGDTTAPEITCPVDQELGCDITTISDYTSLVTATDNSGESPFVTQSPVPGSVFIPGMEITMTATDGSGNSVNCSFILDQLISYLNVGEDVEIRQGEEIQLMAETVATSGTFLWSPSAGLSNPTIANPVAAPTETTSYEVIYTNGEGCVEEDIVTVYVEEIPDDTTAYGFSPDGDGIREFWEIDGIEEFPDNTVVVYNRWGDLVFQIDGYNNTTRVFNGTANKKRGVGADQLPAGTYFFTIQVQGTTPFRKPTGFIVLKR